jgi:protein-S-isoprenylcysteine O-methyltransferase Ste14
MNTFCDYFQIAGLAFFLLVFMGRTLHLRFGKNINPFALGVGKKPLQRIVELSLPVILIAWMIEVLLHATDAEFRLLPAPLEMSLIDAWLAKLFGIALVTVAFVVFVWAMVSFRESWRIGIDEKNKGELVTTGVFAVSRNPVFVFIDLYFLGTFLINGTLEFLVFVALAIVIIHYQIIQEETFLARAYGQAYQDYCARTGRYFGRWNRRAG